MDRIAPQLAMTASSARRPECSSHRAITKSDGVSDFLLLGGSGHAGAKRAALDDSHSLPHNANDCHLLPHDSGLSMSSLKKISRKRRRTGCTGLTFILDPSVGMKHGTMLYCDWGCRIPMYRECRSLMYQLAPSLRPLWKLGSVADFERCYVDIVEAHFRAYEQGLLHRDISDNTVLWHRSPDGQAVGCLVDWDLSCPTHYNFDDESTGPLSRRGTSPFTALDLQYVASDGKHLPQTHRYHHDLESFLWLLVWTIAHYDFQHERRLPCRFPGWIDDWVKRNSFMYTMHTRREYLGLTLEPWQDVRKRWVWPLFRMFSGARDASNDVDEEGLDFLNEERYEELVTFEAFMETIKTRSS